MSLATLSSKDVSRIQKLIERKEALVRQIAGINSELEAIESGASKQNGSPAAAAPSEGPAKSVPPGAVTPRKKGRAGRAVRGSLKQAISAELRSAGKPGMKVKDLAAKLGTSYGNITNFFQNTGKKMNEIKKVGPARFAWIKA
jgi:hypothetical protein